MRILHVIIDTNVGGAETLLGRLLESWKDNPGYTHRVISLIGIGRVGERMRANGVEVAELGLRSVWDVPRVLRVLADTVDDWSPDVVQTWMYHADLLGGVAARLAGNNRIIWGVHSTDITRGSSRATVIVRKVCAWLSQLVPHTVVFVAEASRLVHVGVGYQAPRMTVIPNGVDLAGLMSPSGRREELRGRIGIPEGAVLVGSVGRFNKVKHPENFVRAAGILATENPAVRFMMVGRGIARSNADLVGWIEATGVPDRFTLMGERDDALDCIAAMDVFCLHSLTEACPTVVIEAMGMGIPCVVTDVGDAAVLVGDTGVVVPRNDPGALAGGMAQLVEMTAQQRHDLGAAALERIRERFTIDKVRLQWEELYRNVSQ